MAAGQKLKGALARDPKLQRLSPGVYRNQQGQLVNSGGRRLPRPTPQPQSPYDRYQMGEAAGQMLGQQGGDVSGQAAGQIMGQFPGGRPSPFEMGSQLGQMRPMPWQQMDPGFNIDPGSIVTYPGQLNGADAGQIAGAVAGQGADMAPNSAMRLPQMLGMPQMPQPSANNGGRYRLSPGVYGTREQAMRQYQDAMQQAVGPAVAQAMPMQRRR